MQNYLIGIDGGGSKTAFMLTNRSKEIISELTLGRSNPNDIGIENTAALLLQGIYSLCSQAGIKQDNVAAIYAGIAGVTANDFISRISKAISSELPDSVIGVNHDGLNILYAAFPDRDGVAVICGTGTSCFTKKNDIMHRIGGYGLFDLAGGGFEIGRAAISHALRSIDGRDNNSVLSELVKQKAGFDLIKGLGTLIASGKSNIASYAPLVYKAYLQSDGYARNILEIHTAYLAELINTASRYYNDKYEVSLAGSIGKDPVTMEILLPKLNQNARVSPLDCEPIIGAVNYADFLLQKKQAG